MVAMGQLPNLFVYWFVFDIPMFGSGNIPLLFYCIFLNILVLARGLAFENKIFNMCCGHGCVIEDFENENEGSKGSKQAGVIFDQHQTFKRWMH